MKTRAPVAQIEWSNHCQWNFERREHGVLELWETVGAVEPRRIFAWALDHLENYQQFLLVLLQKFKMTSGRLPEVVHAIIAVQNVFARAHMDQVSSEAQPDS